MRKLLLIATFIFLSSPLFAGTLVQSYGFEDYNVAEGVEHTDGYVFTNNVLSSWQGHLVNTEVLSTCSGKTAYAGTYFWHAQLCSGCSPDPCSGEQCNSSNSRSSLGENGTYPNQGHGDNTSWITAISSNTMVLRFYFRLTGDWKHNGTVNECKFLRFYGEDGASYPIIHMSAEDSSTTSMSIFEPSVYNWADSGVDMKDGNWHSLVVKLVINNDNGTGNVTVSLYADDWSMAAAPFNTHVTTISGFGTKFRNMALLGNLSAGVPTEYMSVDIDNLEVWDGLPSGTPPTADFTQDKTSCSSPCTVTFTDTSTGSPTSWDWDWGDGTTHGTTQNPSHIYSEGTWTPSLTATNASGSSQHTGDQITVTVVPAPVADFVGYLDESEMDYVAPCTINFTDLSTNTPTSWIWDIDNDGDTDYTTQNPSHTYTTPGTYSVRLRATNSAGYDEEIKTDYITVYPPSASAIKICLTNPSGSGLAQSNPSASLGGYRSTTELSLVSMKNLFDDVNVAEGLIGDTEYRMIDVYNAGSVDMKKVQIFMKTPTSSPSTEIAFGASMTDQPHADNWNGEALANESTAPASPVFTFANRTRGSPLSLGTIPAGQSVRVGVKRTVSPLAIWTSNDLGVIGIRWLGGN